MVETACAVKNRKYRRKAASNGETFQVVQEIDVAEYISSDKIYDRKQN